MILLPGNMDLSDQDAVPESVDRDADSFWMALSAT